MKAARAAPARPAPRRGPEVGRAKAPLSELVSSLPEPEPDDEAVSVSVAVAVDVESSSEVDEVLVLDGLALLEIPEEEPPGAEVD